MSRSHTPETDWSTLTDADSDAARADEARVRGGFWRKMGRHAAGIPFAEDAVSAYFAAFDRDTPLKVRAALLAALAYFVLPADLTPDFLPLIGFGDDAAVLFGALKLVSAHITPRHRDAARAALDELRG